MRPSKENLELLACYGCRYKDDCEEPFEHGRPVCNERHVDAVEFAKRLNEDLVKQVRTPPVRPADGVVGGVYESFVPGEDCRGMGLRAKIKSAEHAPAL